MVLFNLRHKLHRCLNLLHERVERKVDRKRTARHLLRDAKWILRHLSYKDLGSL